MVVDSANIQAEVRNVAELLFDLLSSRSINKQLSSILVACNKQGSSVWCGVCVCVCVYVVGVFH